jgi:hypothetical protein
MFVSLVYVRLLLILIVILWCGSTFQNESRFHLKHNNAHDPINSGYDVIRLASQWRFNQDYIVVKDFSLPHIFVSISIVFFFCLHLVPPLPAISGVRTHPQRDDLFSSALLSATSQKIIYGSSHLIQFHFTTDSTRTQHRQKDYL